MEHGTSRMHIRIMTDKSDKGRKPSARSLARWETEGGALKASPVEAGRLGDLKGGAARARTLTPERRKQIAAKAARKRWSKK